MAIAVAGLLAFAAGPVTADHGYWPANGVTPAVVDGHEPIRASTLVAATWGTDCVTRSTDAEAPNGLDVYGHVLEADYALAVVVAYREGVPLDGPYGATLFRDPRAGQFVWADADGNGEFAGKHEADAGALFLCTDPGLPATDALGPAPGSVAAGDIWLRGTVLGLGTLAGMVALLAPVHERRRRHRSVGRRATRGEA